MSRDDMKENSRNRGMSKGIQSKKGKSKKAGQLESRFGRMFDLPSAKPIKDDKLLQIMADAMVKQGDLGAPINEKEIADENPEIPAGYTYLGQFIDHDITFDPTPLHAANMDKDAAIDFRSPALDLDSVYGRGPADQPYLYDGALLRNGQKLDSGSAPAGTRNDVLRIHGPKQNPTERPAIPLLGEKRNDENKIVSQVHSVVIDFHNRIAKSTKAIKSACDDPSDKESAFAAASRLTRWHYQWVVLNDFIPRICEPKTKERYIKKNGKVSLPDYLKPKPRFAYMPVEFAIAAYRFGHSMIRPSYALNRFTGTDITAPRIPLFSRGPSEQNLNGFPGTVPDTWGIDWGYFLEGLNPNAPNPADSGGIEFIVPQPSYRIDALLVDPIKDLPEFFDDVAKTGDSYLGHLAFRNLARGQGVPRGTGLPSGEAVSKHLLGKLSVPADKIWDAGSKAYDPATADQEIVDEISATAEKRKKVVDYAKSKDFKLKNNTPLWYYILREAEYCGIEKNCNEEGIAFGGQHLGPVGSMIVAQTLIGLLYMDEDSILRGGKAFRPLKEVTGGKKLTLAQFVSFATKI